MKIGVDFDNTIVSYDSVFYRTALGHNLISSDTPKDKTAIRDIIRGLKDGEEKWQQLQAQVYGPLMEQGKLIDGVKAFFESCRLNNVEVHIISHKTRFARRDTTRTDLRKSALAFLEKHRFFDHRAGTMNPNQVHFKSTRYKKIKCIKDQGCTHFIDDLVETFHEKTFPGDVEKILFQPRSARCFLPDNIKEFTSWEQIHSYFFPKTAK